MNSRLPNPDPLPLKVVNASMLRVPGIRWLFYCSAEAGSPDFYQGAVVRRSLEARYALDPVDSALELSDADLNILERARAGLRPFGTTLPELSGYRYYCLTSLGVEPCSQDLAKWAQRRVNADASWTILRRSLSRLLWVPMIFFSLLYWGWQWAIALRAQFRSRPFNDPSTSMLIEGLGMTSGWWWAILAFCAAPFALVLAHSFMAELRVGIQPQADLVEP